MRAKLEITKYSWLRVVALIAWGWRGAHCALHHPYPRVFYTLPSFARIKRPRWQPVQPDDRHLRAQVKIGDCEQSNMRFPQPRVSPFRTASQGFRISYTWKARALRTKLILLGEHWHTKTSLINSFIAISIHMSLNVWGMKFNFFATYLPTKIAELLFWRGLTQRLASLLMDVSISHLLVPWVTRNFFLKINQQKWESTWQRQEN